MDAVRGRAAVFESRVSSGAKMSIKRIWVSPAHEGNRLFSISIRQEPNTPQLNCLQTMLPPIEEIDGKRLNEKEAKDRGLMEPHFNIGYFTAEELYELRDQIEKRLG